MLQKIKNTKSIFTFSITYNILILLCFLMVGATGIEPVTPTV